MFLGPEIPTTDIECAKNGHLDLESEVPINIRRGGDEGLELEHYVYICGFQGR